MSKKLEDKVEKQDIEKSVKRGTNPKFKTSNDVHLILSLFLRKIGMFPKLCTNRNFTSDYETLAPSKKREIHLVQVAS